MTDQEVDQIHDQMLAGEGHLFDSVMRGAPGPEPAKHSVLPSTTRHLPSHWLGEEDLESEIFNGAVEDP
jgi:hypothetical protein